MLSLPAMIMAQWKMTQGLCRKISSWRDQIATSTWQLIEAKSVPLKLTKRYKTFLLDLQKSNQILTKKNKNKHFSISNKKKVPRASSQKKRNPSRWPPTNKKHTHRGPNHQPPTFHPRARRLRW